MEKLRCLVRRAACDVGSVFDVLVCSSGLRGDAVQQICRENVLTESGTEGRVCRGKMSVKRPTPGRRLMETPQTPESL